jgi:hypothetical protein
MSGSPVRAIAGAGALVAVAVATVAWGGPVTTAAGARVQSTQLISRAADGGVPNGASTHAVISGDRRYARAIAFQSLASDLVAHDSNGLEDVFVVLRRGPFNNRGTRWQARRTVLLSRGRNGAPANGASFLPAIGGDLQHSPTCVGFLSQASNLVAGDRNGRIDAFVAKLSRGSLRRVSVPRASADSTAVAVSGDCTAVAFVTGGKLYVSKRGGKPRRVGPAGAADPSFSSGRRNDLVFGAPRGVYLARDGTKHPRLLARGGRNPAYNDNRNRVVTYEKTARGQSQIAYKELGKRERIISARKGAMGNGASRAPVIANSGFYVTFETDASNLGVNTTARKGDENGKPDAYLYTETRGLTLVQSVVEKAVPVPGGGQNPSMSFYANYILFDSPHPLGSKDGVHQVYMRYLGGV